MNKVQNLDTSVNDVLTHHEKDFLSAFKTHMYGVYNKLMELKKRTADEELDWQRRSKLDSLNSSLNWFKDESLRLNDRL